MAPIFRRLAARHDIDPHVAYCSLRGAQSARGPEFGATFRWDIPPLDGYSWTQVRNLGSGGEGFLGLCNPGLWKIVREGNFDATLCFTGYRRATFWISWLATTTGGSSKPHP